MPRADLDRKPDEVAAMFDAVATRYDLANGVLSLGLDRRWRSATVRAVDAAPGDVVLDLAAGTGTSSEPFAAVGVRVVPCDFSFGMLAAGKARRPDLSFVMGDALRLPFADGSFDAVTISFGLRNVADVSAALAEMLRVTRPGGRMVVCEFSRPESEPWRAVVAGYEARVLPLFARASSSDPDAYAYLAETIREWPDQLTLGRLMLRVGWTDVAYRNLTGGVVALHRAVRPAADAFGEVKGSTGRS
jgi:demethylmenaquinone methyltransferase/2-methoxy-6-polyprenyl-1,4-benzoquinol methylase